MKESSKILKTKWKGELAVKEEFPEATIIRPSVIYGHKDKFISHYMDQNRLILNEYIIVYKLYKNINHNINDMFIF